MVVLHQRDSCEAECQLVKGPVAVVGLISIFVLKSVEGLEFNIFLVSVMEFLGLG